MVVNTVFFLFSPPKSDVGKHGTSQSLWRARKHLRFFVLGSQFVPFHDVINMTNKGE